MIDANYTKNVFRRFIPCVQRSWSSFLFLLFLVISTLQRQHWKRFIIRRREERDTYHTSIKKLWTMLFFFRHTANQILREWEHNGWYIHTHMLSHVVPHKREFKQKSPDCMLRNAIISLTWYRRNDFCV